MMYIQFESEDDVKEIDDLLHTLLKCKKLPPKVMTALKKFRQLVVEGIDDMTENEFNK